MKYDFYNQERMYKPKLALKARDRLHRKVLRNLDIHSVLEIGVGFGEFASYCQRHEIAYVGIETNKNLRNTLMAKGFKVYESAMPNFPEMSEQFDAIFAAHLIEHLDGLPEVVKFLDGCRHVLESHKGKYLILLYPDVEKCGFSFWHDYTHSFVTMKKRVEDILFDHGWNVVWSKRYTVCFFRFSSLIRIAGKVFPYFLLPRDVQLFVRLSFQQHCATVALPR